MTRTQKVLPKSRPKQGRGKVQATFHLVREDELRRLDRTEVERMLLYMFQALGSGVLKERFKRFVAVVQAFSRPPGEVPYPTHYVLPGEIDWVERPFLQKVLRVKYLHQSPQYRIAGNKSTHPPAFLDAETLVFVIGDVGFLARTVDLALERKGELGEQAYQTFLELCDLQSFHHKKKGKWSKPSHYTLEVEHKKFYPGYFDALMAGIKGLDVELEEDPPANFLTTAEVLRMTAE